MLTNNIKELMSCLEWFTIRWPKTPTTGASETPILELVYAGSGAPLTQDTVPIYSYIKVNGI